MKQVLTIRMEPRVAIVGGGLAGLSAAYHCSQGGARVTLFEGSEALGARASAVVPSVGLGGFDLLFPALHPSLIDFCNKKEIMLREHFLVARVTTDAEGGEGKACIWKTGVDLWPITGALARIREAVARGIPISLNEGVEAFMQGLSKQDIEEKEEIREGLLVQVFRVICAPLWINTTTPITRALLEALPYSGRVRVCVPVGGMEVVVKALVEGIPGEALKRETRVRRVLGSSKRVFYEGGPEDGEAFDSVILATNPEAVTFIYSDPSPEVHLALHSFGHLHTGARVARGLDLGLDLSKEDEDKEEDEEIPVVLHSGVGASFVALAPFGEGNLAVTQGHLPEGTKVMGERGLIVPIWTPQGQRAARVLAKASGKEGIYFVSGGMRGSPSLNESFAMGRAAAEGATGLRRLGDESASSRREDSERTSLVLNFREKRTGSQCIQ